MNTSLTKYLSEVFRNEIQEDVDLELAKNQDSSACIDDQKITRFLVDGRYTRRLDEII